MARKDAIRWNRDFIAWYNREINPHPHPLYNIVPAMPQDELDRLVALWKTQAEYDAYMAYLEEHPDEGLPMPENLEDYYNNKDRWAEERAHEAEPSAPTQEQIEEYNNYLDYLKAHPDKELPKPFDIQDYLKHRDEWAPGWMEEEPTPWPEEPEPYYSDEEVREYNTYRDYGSRFRDPGDWMPVDIADYFRNWDTAQEQLTEWKTLATKEEQQKTEREQEAYGEAPEYGQSFSNWFGAQGSRSQPLQSFIEGMFGTLRTQYQATQPRLTGFPTREEARTEAERREAGFEAWLPKQIPAVEEQFWAQAPRRRWEAPGTFAPRIRSVAF